MERMNAAYDAELGNPGTDLVSCEQYVPYDERLSILPKKRRKLWNEPCHWTATTTRTRQTDAANVNFRQPLNRRRPLSRPVFRFFDIFEGGLNDTAWGTNVHTHETAACLPKQCARTHAHASVMYEKMPEMRII